MEKKTYGYIRVSTIAQHDDRQRLTMEDFGVEEQFLFVDKQSGKDFDRPAYQALPGKLVAGDTFVVKSLDRLILRLTNKSVKPLKLNAPDQVAAARSPNIQYKKGNM